MKTEKTNKAKKTIKKIDCIDQFNELYFPSLAALKNKKSAKSEENYGGMIAMSILDGIKRDLSALRK